jgi:uncharacterized SAM-binding protein YcdF (DUF218 family)
MSHAARLGLSLLVGAIAATAWGAYRVQQQGASDEERPADAIVVLGAAQYNGRPSPVLEARISHAVDLYEDGIAPILIVTGGKATGDRTTEAAAAAFWAAANGVPAEAILAEDHGRTTLESLEAVAVIMRDRHLTSAVFVSDRTHMLRVLRIATDQGIVAWGSPTPTSPVDADPASRTTATIHELGALALYFAGAGRIVGEEPTSAAP